jgi:methionyl-tRNA synthetase
MADTFFITTAIDYTNGAPHIGHAYEKVLADVLARYHRLKGDDVFFLTGVDQHGQKVQQSAEKQGIAPQEFVDGITAKFVALWEKLNLRYDRWAATTAPSHKECVRAILQRLWDDKGPDGQSKWIYKKSEGGYYSVRQEQFLTEKERGPDGEFGPEWGQVEFREEENFYFRLLDHKQWLLDLIESRSEGGKPLVIPDFRVGELRNAVEKLEGDLCISRPASRLQWGIPFPESFGTGFVTFVWFDALVNYISFAPGYDPLGGPRSSASGSSAEFWRWWPALHVIGKDILIPAHGVYWPIMLKALGFDGDDIPQLLVHGWWNISGEKMSKTLGNVIDPDKLVDLVGECVGKELLKQKAKDAEKGKPTLDDQQIAEVSTRCGCEAVRYYLVSDIATGKDADFSHERLFQRYNTDLANSLGNLLDRTLNMVSQYRASVLKYPAVDNSRSELQAQINEGVSVVSESFAGHDPAGAIRHVCGLLGICDKFVEANAPWKLVKSPEPADAERVDAILYSLAESLRIIAILLSPVLPQAAQAIFDQMQWKVKDQGQETRFRLADTVWGGLPDGHQLGRPSPLFPRLEVPKAT